MAVDAEKKPLVDVMLAMSADQLADEVEAFEKRFQEYKTMELARLMYARLLDIRSDVRQILRHRANLK